MVDNISTTAIACIMYTWWRHQMETFSALLALCAGNSPVPVNYPHKGQWRGALVFSLIYAWIDDWVNNREACDLRRQRDHYDVTVMDMGCRLLWLEYDFCSTFAVAALYQTWFHTCPYDKTGLYCIKPLFSFVQLRSLFATNHGLDTNEFLESLQPQIRSVDVWLCSVDNHSWM